MSHQRKREAMDEKITTTSTEDQKTQSLQAANQSLRTAVESRIKRQSVSPYMSKRDKMISGDPSAAAHAACCVEHDYVPGLRPGTDKFMGILDEVRVMHIRKTQDYGKATDALSNIRESADIINTQAYAGAILRMSDKMHRLRAFFHNGKTEFDGIEDTLLDLCAYSAIALVLFREEQSS